MKKKSKRKKRSKRKNLKVSRQKSQRRKSQRRKSQRRKRSNRFIVDQNVWVTFDKAHVKQQYTGIIKSRARQNGYLVYINELGSINWFSAKNLRSINNKCTKTVKFSEQSIKILKKLLNKPTEYSGEMYIKQGKIHVKKSKIKKGDASETDSIDHRYTFHVHPRIAYIQLNTDIGFPSQSDFDVFLDSFIDFKNIFTVLAGLEGLYITMMNPIFLNLKRKKKARKYIEKYFGLDKTNFNKNIGMRVYHSHIYTPNDFCDYVNTCPWRNGESLFKVVFIPWNRAQDMSFEFSYKKRKGKCRVNDNYPVKKFQSQYI